MDRVGHISITSYIAHHHLSDMFFPANVPLKQFGTDGINRWLVDSVGSLESQDFPCRSRHFQGNSPLALTLRLRMAEEK